MTNTDRATTVSLGGDTCPSGIENWELPGLLVGPDSGPSDFVSPKSSCQEHQELELPSALQSNITFPHSDHEECVYCHDIFLKTDGYFYRGEFMCDDCTWVLAENGEFYCG